MIMKVSLLSSYELSSALRVVDDVDDDPHEQQDAAHEREELAEESGQESDSLAPILGADHDGGPDAEEHDPENDAPDGVHESGECEKEFHAVFYLSC